MVHEVCPFPFERPLLNDRRKLANITRYLKNSTSEAKTFSLTAEIRAFSKNFWILNTFQENVRRFSRTVKNNRLQRTMKGNVSFFLKDLLLVIIISFLPHSLDRTKRLFFVFSLRVTVLVASVRPSLQLRFRHILEMRVRRILGAGG